MSSLLRRSVLWATLSALALTAASHAATGAEPEVLVPWTPVPFAADGRQHLVYELLITNGTAAPLTLRSIEAVAASGTPLQTLEGANLSAAIRRDQSAEIEPGAATRVHLWISVDRVPPSIHHTLRFLADGNLADVAGPDVVPDRSLPVVIGPPLRGEAWWTGNGPDNNSGHRRAAIRVPRDVTPIAQRFAIDYVQVANGASFAGDAADNRNYFAYGENVLSVAEGIVVGASDGAPENVPGQLPEGVTRETASGNFVVVDIGAGRFAFYGHLRPGSVQVQAGDRVRRGTVLGQVGNSGNSTEPHLHFHIADSPEPLLGEGLPYLVDEFDSARPVPGGARPPVYEPVRNELPLGSRVLRFHE